MGKATWDWRSQLSLDEQVLINKYDSEIARLDAERACICAKREVIVSRAAMKARAAGVRIKPGDPSYP